ncbi:Histone-lysine N-methyltransferase set9 [Tulasnella sp. 408]|nr:Histone-lysine N-methyltransferase set9 [Tulasnella sp. 408]
MEGNGQHRFLGFSATRSRPPPPSTFAHSQFPRHQLTALNMPPSSRPVRAVRLLAAQKHSDLPFPEGAPNPVEPVEILIHQLNIGDHPSDQLARVDDFVIRACFESKFKKRPRDTEVQKFVPERPILTVTTMKIAREWRVVREGPLSTWIAGAKRIWDEVVVPSIKDGHDGNLRPGDSELFMRLLVRYYLIYHPKSPIKLGVVIFPGEATPQRGIVARVPILHGTFLLEAGGIVSNNSPARKISGFSTIMHKGNRPASNRLLLWNVPDIDSPGGLASNCYTLRALRDIVPGEEITVHYGSSYFQGGLECLCSHCLPGQSPVLKPGLAAPPDGSRPDLVIAKKRARNGKGTYRTPKKLRPDVDFHPSS